MRPTCALGAPPAPTTVFLMVAGAYSAIVSPACAAARRTTPRACPSTRVVCRSEEHTSELQSPCNLVCRLLLEKKKNQHIDNMFRRAPPYSGGELCVRTKSDSRRLVIYHSYSPLTYVPLLLR